MPRQSLLKQSWNETRETMERVVGTRPWLSVVAAAVLLATVGVVISQTRGHDTLAIDLRADQQALSTTTTSFGFTEPTFPLSTTSTPQPLATGSTLPGTGLIKPRGSGSGSGAATARSTAPTGATGGSATTTSTTLLSFAPSAFNLNRIAYVASGGTWTVNADGTDPQPIAPNAFMPAWSPSHSSIAVASADKPGGAISYVSSSGSRSPLTAGDPKLDSSPAWSPDGSHLVFSRFEQGQYPYSTLWVIDRDGTNLHRVAASGCFNQDPSWSSDGVHIAFWSSRDHCTSEGGTRFGDYELYVMNSDGANVTRLGTAPSSGAPAFSPDGSTIAFATDRDGNFEIYTTKLDGSNQKRITTAVSADTDPTWSPDGTRIAFRSDRSSGGIYTMKADGTDVRYLVSGTEPSWS